jgi:hypothetical protein
MSGDWLEQEKVRQLRKIREQLEELVDVLKQILKKV